MSEPTFLVIGAQKSGTTWLYQTMRRHPQVFATTPKGLYFFDNPDHFAKGLGWYQGHFTPSAQHKASGEFTPNYFWTTADRTINDGRTLPQRIHDHLPEAKIIVAMREPVDRAVSAYYHHIKAGRIRPDQRLLDVAHLHGIRDMGFYDEHMACWLEAYPKEQIMALIYEEDIGKQGQETLKKIWQFIDVDDSFEPPFTGYRYNKRRSHLHMRFKHRSERLANLADRILPGVIKNHRRFQIPVHDHERQQLAALYKPHNERLADMLGRPLPWQNP